MSYVNIDNPASRPDGGTYATIINKIAEDGVCPFCPDHLKKYHKPAVIETTYWILTDNMYPYKPNKHHRLLIHREHISHFSEVSPEAWTELKQLADKEMAAREIAGGTFIMRFGQTRFTGASVTHLHAHIIQSDPDDPTYDKQKGLMMRVG